MDGSDQEQHEDGGDKETLELPRLQCAILGMNNVVLAEALLSSISSKLGYGIVARKAALALGHS